MATAAGRMITTDTIAALLAGRSTVAQVFPADDAQVTFTLDAQAALTTALRTAWGKFPVAFVGSAVPPPGCSVPDLVLMLDVGVALGQCVTQEQCTLPGWQLLTDGTPECLTYYLFGDIGVDGSPDGVDNLARDTCVAWLAHAVPEYGAVIAEHLFVPVEGWLMAVVNVEVYRCSFGDDDCVPAGALVQRCVRNDGKPIRLWESRLQEMGTSWGAHFSAALPAARDSDPVTRMSSEIELAVDDLACVDDLVPSLSFISALIGMLPTQAQPPMYESASARCPKLQPGLCALHDVVVQNMHNVILRVFGEM